jgi:Na+/H+ antiporter NhaD/arsenite permease-like protein
MPLPIDQLILIVIIAGTTTLYISNWLPTEVTSTIAIAALVLTGILTPDQALSGFASTATVTVAAMFVLSAGLMRTGALEAVTLQLGRFARGNATRLLVLLAAVEIPASAFMNNTPVVVMMVPVVISLCRQYRLRASKFLLPVSYFAILGGTCTLIGTSTNILVDDLYRKSGGPGFGLFDFSILGIAYALAGTLFITFVGQRLLPSRAPLANLLGDRQSTTYVTEIQVTAQSKLAAVRRARSSVTSWWRAGRWWRRPTSAAAIAACSARPRPRPVPTNATNRCACSRCCATNRSTRQRRWSTW